MLQQSNTLPYLLIIKSMTIYTIIHSAIQQSITTIQSIVWHSEYKAYRVIIHEQGDRLPAAGGPLPMRTPGAARRTINQLSKTMNFVFFTVFYCFCHLCYLISARRPISREDAHQIFFLRKNRINLAKWAKSHTSTQQWYPQPVLTEIGWGSGQ